METIGGILAFSVLLTLLSFLWLVVVAFGRSTSWGTSVFLLSPFSAIIFAMTNWRDASKAFSVYILSFIVMIAVILHINAEVGSRNLSGIYKRIQNKEITLGEASDLFAQAYKGQALFNNDKIPPLPLGETGEDLATDGTSTIAVNQSVPQLAANRSAPVEEVVQDANADSVAATANLAENKSVEETPATEQEQVEQPQSASASTTTQQVGSDEMSLKELAQLKKRAKPDPLQIKQKVDNTPKTIKVSVSKAKNYIGRYFLITTHRGAKREGYLQRVSTHSLFFKRKLFQGKFDFEVRKKTIKSLRMLRQEKK